MVFTRFDPSMSWDFITARVGPFTVRPVFWNELFLSLAPWEPSKKRLSPWFLKVQFSMFTLSA